ncbi:MAG: hypothetical protein OIN83_05520 [Candidatus Methanoperedens sp.]|nr:hypothetical protein [Candidatus Methanoperedens sp.]
MNTLLEFITFVKGVEYMIVIAFCFGFIALWILVNSKDKMGMSKIVSFVIPLSLMFGGGAILLSSSDTSDIPVVANATEAAVIAHPGIAEKVALSSNAWPTVNKTEYLSIALGPATAFHAVMSEKLSCTTCHHNSGDEIHACKDCHDSPTNPHDSTKPGLKAAYHERCISCHKEEISGPDSCKKCHTGEANTASVVAAPARPHQLTWDTCNRCHQKGIPNGGVASKIVYHDSCIKCHSTGISGAALIPEDHVGRAGSTCQGCHKPVGG